MADYTKGNLVLHRKVGESLTIGEIRIDVLQATNGHVRLAVVAPKHIPVYRDDTRNKTPKAREVKQ